MVDYAGYPSACYCTGKLSSTVTVVCMLYTVVAEVSEPDIGRNLVFRIQLYLTSPAKVMYLKYRQDFCYEKLNGNDFRLLSKVDDISSHLDTIHECDRRTDRQTISLACIKMYNTVFCIAWCLHGVKPQELISRLDSRTLRPVNAYGPLIIFNKNNNTNNGISDIRDIKR